jgi:hypothetical protein
MEEGDFERLFLEYFWEEAQVKHLDSDVGLWLGE